MPDLVAANPVKTCCIGRGTEVAMGTDMHRKVAVVAVLSASVLALLAALPREAEACGGCFAPPDEVTTVDSHRMVISLGMEETVLWDQIVYSGDPEDFVWVLPVPSEEVAIELADEDFFTWLDAGTAPRIQPLSPPPQTFCGGGGSVGCGAVADGSGGAASPEDGVTVYDQSVVGPYETVTIGAENPDALLTWLNDNGYAIPQTTIATLDHYIALESVFVVLRLQPGQGVQAMQPVRIRYPGYMNTFPLKMVVVGAKGVLDLALWVIAEQRYEARNYGTLRIDEDDLAWDWADNTSNYRQVFEDTVEQGGNRAWVVEYAGALDQLALSADVEPGDLEAARNDIPYPYLTRLRTRILVEHIDEDLQLAPSADSTDISNFYLAPNDLNRPADVECEDDAGCTAGVGGGLAGASGLALFMIAGLAVVLRRRRG
jgi:hypothetical protein